MPYLDQPALQHTRFATFDGALAVSTAHQRPDRYRDLQADFGSSKRIARGAGLSYAAASFGEGVVVQEMSAFNRLLEFDESASTLRVEAGINLHQLLIWAEQHQLTIPVLPGYPLITLGGCIAADVHGKNPLRDGTFSDWVESLTLFHPSVGFRTVTRNDDPGLFELTCGGYGLTGIIVDATLRLTAQPHRAMEVHCVSTGSFAESVEQLREAADANFAYTWHDGTARDGRFGRGLLFSGRLTDEHPMPITERYIPVSAVARGDLPMSLWNRTTVAAANAAFRHMAKFRSPTIKSTFDASFPFARQTAYHRFYGKRGFAEMQLLVPDEQIEELIVELGELVRAFSPLLVMMSMKAFHGRQRSLSISGKGLLLALDLVRNETTNAFLGALDSLAHRLGAQPNIAKDSRLSAETAERTLPYYGLFRSRLHEWDPQRLYQSEMSRRLRL